jgi:hypothetical protein
MLLIFINQMTSHGTMKGPKNFRMVRESEEENKMSDAKNLLQKKISINVTIFLLTCLKIHYFAHLNSQPRL